MVITVTLEGIITSCAALSRCHVPAARRYRRRAVCTATWRRTRAETGRCPRRVAGPRNSPAEPPLSEPSPSSTVVLSTENRLAAALALHVAWTWRHNHGHDATAQGGGNRRKDKLPAAARTWNVFRERGCCHCSLAVTYELERECLSSRTITLITALTNDYSAWIGPDIARRWV